METRSARQRKLAAPSVDLPVTEMQIRLVRKLLSDCYLNVPERLQMEEPSRCALEALFCLKFHYKNRPPEFAESLYPRRFIEKELFKSFHDHLLKTSMQGQFPDSMAFVSLFEIILVMLPKSHVGVPIFITLYTNMVSLFQHIVENFPPCWLALRPHYGYLLDTFVINKGARNVPKYDLSSAPPKLIPMLLKLVEMIISECDPDSLGDENNLNIIVDHDNFQVNPSTEKHKFWPYTYEICLDNFYLVNNMARLTRVMDALRLLANLLEKDCIMWLQHNSSDFKQSILNWETCPFIVKVAELTKNERYTGFVVVLFKAYAMGVAKGLHRTRLAVLMSYVTMTLETSNIADLEFDDDGGFNYPSIAENTTILLTHFIDTFQMFNLNQINNYMLAISQIKLPYMRYQFIDSFLQVLGLWATSEPLTPKKIANALIQHSATWLKYNSRTNPSIKENEISMEDYLDVLLNAMRAYCQWYGIVRIFKRLYGEPKAAQGPIRVKDISLLLEPEESQVEPDARNAMPMIISNDNLAPVNIFLSKEAINQYQNDLKELVILVRELPKFAAAHPSVNLTDWLEFLKQFKTKTDDQTEEVDKQDIGDKSKDGNDSKGEDETKGADGNDDSNIAGGDTSKAAGKDNTNAATSAKIPKKRKSPRAAASLNIKEDTKTNVRMKRQRKKI